MKVVCLFMLAIAATSHGLTHPNEYGKLLSKLAGPAREKCMKESGVDIQDIENCSKGIFKDDIKLKKYVGCVRLELGSIDRKTGKVDLDRIYELAPPHLRADVAKVIKNCDVQTKAHEDVNEKAFHLLKCFYTVDPENFIMV